MSHKINTVLKAGEVKSFKLPHTTVKCGPNDNTTKWIVIFYFMSCIYIYECHKHYILIRE